MNIIKNSILTGRVKQGLKSLFMPKYIHHKVLLFVQIIVLTAISQAGHARDSSMFQFTGFGSIGLTKGGNDELGIRQNYSQHGEYGGDWQFKTDSSLGFQINADFNRSFDAVVQVLARDQVSNSFERSIEWAFLRYRPTSTIDIRVGRMALDMFNISEYRNVGFAYLEIRPPVEFYGPVPLSNIDGVDLMFSNRVVGGILQSKFFFGQAKDKIFFEGDSYNINFKPTYGINLSFQKGSWKTRFTLIKVKFTDVTGDVNTDSLKEVFDGIPSFVWPGVDKARENLDLNGSEIIYTSLGVSYDYSDWIFQGELSDINSTAGMAASNNAGYVTIGKRITRSITVYSKYARVLTSAERNTVEPPTIDHEGLWGLYDYVEILMNSNKVDQYSYSVGLRWNLMPKLTMKMEWDHVHVEKDSPGLYVTKLDLRAKDIEMDNFALTFNFIF